jgi:hypothetical protein
LEFEVKKKENKESRQNVKQRKKLLFPCFRYLYWYKHNLQYGKENGGIEREVDSEGF